MVSTDKEQPPLVLRRTERGLEPRTKLAAEILEQYALHSDVELKIKKRRSLPQLALYWLMLRRVVDATGAWPSSQHLHDALKVDLGYTTPIKTMDGKLLMIPDSAAMAKMDSAQFKAFFDAAAKRLAEVCGFDPLAEMEKEAA
jgi:hypothetical protein